MALERVKTWIAGEILTASDLNNEFDNIVDYVNGLQTSIDTNTSDIADINDELDDINGDIVDLQNQIDDLGDDIDDTNDLINALVPVGTIIAFYNYDNATSYNAAYWQLCDGSLIDDDASPFDAENAPDLSGRYLVGYGTDDGADMDTAVWNTAPVGNAAHQVDLRHSHTSAAHTHTSAAHSHGEGTLRFRVFEYTTSGTKFVGYDSGGSDVNIATVRTVGTNFSDAPNVMVKSPSSSTNYYTTAGSGSTNSTTPGSTGSTTPGSTGQNLSTTQSIQPRSIRVYYLLRKK